MTDTAQVNAAAGTAAAIAISDINAYLTTFSVLIAIGFSLRKWYLMEKDKRKNNSPYKD